MRCVTVEEAQAALPELIRRMTEGEEIIITLDRNPVAQLVAPAPARPRPVFGSCSGRLVVVSEDDEYLADFRDYQG